MATTTTARIWSDEEVLALPKNGQDIEVIHGEVVVSPAGSEHGAIIMAIAGPLHMYVLKKQLGRVLDGQTGCRMSSGDVLSPDVSFVTTARWEAHRKTRAVFFPGGPDLAVEVLSPDDSLRVLKKKIHQYFADGTRLAWVVHPRKRCVTVYHAPTSADILTTADTLDGEHVVPGFSLKIVHLFR
jgi:Uma2 family endonuclease